MTYKEVFLNRENSVVTDLFALCDFAGPLMLLSFSVDSFFLKRFGYLSGLFCLSLMMATFTYTDNSPPYWEFP